jgi:hypothetical protein
MVIAKSPSLDRGGSMMDQASKTDQAARGAAARRTRRQLFAGGTGALALVLTAETLARAAPAADEPTGQPAPRLSPLSESSKRKLARLGGTSALITASLAALAIGIFIGNAARKRIDRLSHGIP